MKCWSRTVCLVLLVLGAPGCKTRTPQRGSGDPLPKRPPPAKAEAKVSRELAGAGAAKLDARGEKVVASISAFNRDLAASDRRAKFSKMAASTLGFYRGTNHLFWADLGADKRLAQHGDAKTRVWLQGDAHLFNFGAFQNSRRKIVYDLNDFDESILGDYQLDLWRLAISVVLAAGHNNRLDASDPPFGDAAIKEAVVTLGEAYLKALRGFVGNAEEDKTVVTEKHAFGKLDEFLKAARKDNSRKKMLAKWAKVVDGKQLLKDEGDYAGDSGPVKLAKVDDAVVDAIETALPQYARTLSGGLPWSESYFAVKSVRRRLLAGTGSLGRLRYYVLIEGRKDKNKDDVILDVKLQKIPSAYPYLDKASRDHNQRLCEKNQALRTVTGYRALGVHPDDHLGWLKLAQGTFSVRERSPYKETFDIEKLNSPKRLNKLATQWGTILATAHARADNDWKPSVITYSFEKQVSARLKKKDKEGFLDTLVEVATSYAAQVNADRRAFCARLARCPS